MVTKKELTAYCGLYCGDCIRYRSRASDLARYLLEDLKNTQFAEYAKIKSSSEKQLDAVKQFENYQECCDVLDSIVKLQCNNPCRTGGGCNAFSCGILECCRKKGLEGCWQCPRFESCEELSALKSIHGDSAQQNLKAIKEFGMENWTEHRHNPYIWQE
jgi:hypothetical protein